MVLIPVPVPEPALLGSVPVSDLNSMTICAVVYSGGYNPPECLRNLKKKIPGRS